MSEDASRDRSSRDPSSRDPSKGARIPESAEDMPGGPGGGEPIRPPKKKRNGGSKGSEGEGAEPKG